MLNTISDKDMNVENVSLNIKSTTAENISSANKYFSCLRNAVYFYLNFLCDRNISQYWTYTKK